MSLSTEMLIARTRLDDRSVEAGRRRLADQAMAHRHATRLDAGWRIRVLVAVMRSPFRRPRSKAGEDGQ